MALQPKEMDDHAQEMACHSKVMDICDKLMHVNSKVIPNLYGEIQISCKEIQLRGEEILRRLRSSLSHSGATLYELEEMRCSGGEIQSSDEEMQYRGEEIRSSGKEM